MIRNWHNTLAIIIVIVFGSTLFYIGTDGFHAFTMETARVNQLMAEKPVFPNVTFEDSKGRSYSASEFEGKHVLITFIYTSCTTVCVELEKNMAQVYDLVPSQYIGEDILFLSISFDPERDTPEVLEKYRGYFNSDGETWRMATINDRVELADLLKAFGVIVIPDEYGHYAHNSAFYLIDGRSRLIEVMDYRKIDEAAHTIVAILDTEEGEEQ